MPSTTLTIKTTDSKQILDITPQIDRWLAGAGIRQGLCNIFVAHTTAGITTGEAIEGTAEDLTDTLGAIIPKIDFRHAHNPSHAPDHMVASIVGASLGAPIRDGKLQLGDWQRVLFVERNGPRKREVVLTAVPA